ncbi:MAG: DUF6134 family protein [Parvibaculum sp.]|uniref:DUF6134 family protein n=1 Tax=Parvibaculum sp. TaxID=2024848 RepID=UPI0034A08277
MTPSKGPSVVTSPVLKVAALTLLLLVPGLGAGAALPASSPDPAQAPALAFRVERGGTPIGTHRISFTQEGDALIVDIEINLAVTFGPLTLFHYEHRNREVWRGGKLVSLDTETDDDGHKYTVSARASDGGLAVTSSAHGSLTAPADIIPTSYWNPATVTQMQLLDTQAGRIVDVTVTPVATREVAVDGAAVTAREYEMAGDLKLRLLYSLQNEWLNVAFVARGEEVDYTVERLDRALVQRVASR